MPSGLLLSLIVLLAIVGGAVKESSAAPPVRFMDSHEVRIDVQADQSLSRVELYCSRDGGRSWQKQLIARQAAGSIWTRVDEDGPYDFFLVLTNAQNQSSPLPQPDVEPHVRMIVDTRPPTLQLHHARVTPLTADRHALRVRLTLIEEHLGRESVRVLLNSPRGEWIDIGPVTRTDDELLGTIPVEALSSREGGLRVVVTDLAGNRAADALERIEFNLPAPPEPPDVAADADLDWDAPVAPAPEPLARERSQIEALRALAAEFRRRGQTELAIARLHEALGHAPGDADLLSELAGDLLSQQRHFDAAERYQQALLVDPRHARSLAGMALLHYTRREYQPARDHLRRLLEVTPDDARALLRYGDAEQRLGHSDAAMDAWRRIIELTPPTDANHQRARERLRTLQRR